MKHNDIYKLPKVGDRLIRHLDLGVEGKKLYPCVVTYVNKSHSWYQVTFDSGIRACFKVPEVNYIQWVLETFQKDYETKLNKRAVGIYAFESGFLYPSITECAKDIGVTPYYVNKHLNGQLENVKGYHLYKLM